MDGSLQVFARAPTCPSLALALSFPSCCQIWHFFQSLGRYAFLGDTRLAQRRWDASPVISRLPCVRYRPDGLASSHVTSHVLLTRLVPGLARHARPGQTVCREDVCINHASHGVHIAGSPSHNSRGLARQLALHRNFYPLGGRPYAAPRNSSSGCVPEKGVRDR